MRVKTLLNLIILVILFSFTFVTSHGEEDFAKAEELIKQKIPCSELTDDQLEILGEYYMEQMHSGELHEIMDERMGGEGSYSLKQVHINMGKMFYCGEQRAMPMGMMNIMMGRNYRMMNGYPLAYYGKVSPVWLLFNILFLLIIIILLILLIIWLIKKINT